MYSPLVPVNSPMASALCIGGAQTMMMRTMTIYLKIYEKKYNLYWNRGIQAGNRIIHNKLRVILMKKRRQCIIYIYMI
jgi:hypothetical protein